MKRQGARGTQRLYRDHPMFSDFYRPRTLSGLTSIGNGGDLPAARSVGCLPRCRLAWPLHITSAVFILSLVLFAGDPRIPKTTIIEQGLPPLPGPKHRIMEQSKPEVVTKKDAARSSEGRAAEEADQKATREDDKVRCSIGRKADVAINNDVVLPPTHRDHGLRTRPTQDEGPPKKAHEERSGKQSYLGGPGRE